MNKNVKIITYMAICLIINYICSSIALFLKLPIYLDTIGTMIASLSFGLVYGLGVATLSALLNWITTDIYALYYLPVAIIIAISTNIVYHRNKKINRNIIVKAFLISILATIVASLITAILFHGITSSGSSIFVQIFNKLGLSLTTSIILVQVVTDYFDKLISVFIALYVSRYIFIKN